jgi:DNA polymerase elongation subunit (family B)
MFFKADLSPFSEEEQEALLSEINSLLPKEIKFANDGIFRRVVYLKAKNYVMEDSKGKRKIKGSALKSSTLEPILKEMLNEFIDAIIADKLLDLPGIYMKYVEMVPFITDIKPWCTKKTLSATTYASPRKNETDIIDAIAGSEYVEGDKVYLYATVDEKWCLAERFDGKYSFDTYFEKIFKTAQRFSTIMDTKALFPNYCLKKPQAELLQRLGVVNPKPPKERKKKNE